MNIYLFVNFLVKSNPSSDKCCQISSELWELYQYEKEENNSIHFRIAPNFESRVRCVGFEKVDMKQQYL